MKTFLYSIILTLMSAISANAEYCYFETGGKIYIQGECYFNPLGGGDFFIADNQLKPDYFVYFYLNQGVGEAYWNEERRAARAHTPIDGVLRRVGGCWVNNSTRICAWK
ncbi:MAG: hypothetical protein COA53_08605 [Rhodobacteraceae bacterium]|nr:MAG: hypothetical protein COA53_08605 [Paracoccaceae bacterium]